MTEEPIEAVIARLKLLAGEDSCGISVENKARLARLLDYVEGMQWQPIETAPTGRNVLIAFQNSLGKWRYAKAALIAPRTQETYGDSDWLEYDDETDTYWLPGGWYEDVEAETGSDFTRFHLSGVRPTHWLPLPQPPSGEQPK